MGIVKKTVIHGSVLLLLLFCPSLVLSVEVAPRITDREIIEKLTRLEEGQQTLIQRIEDTNRRIDDTNQRLESTNQRLEGLNQRLEGLNQRLEGLSQRLEGLSQRLEDTNQRIGDTNQRIGELREFLLWGFGVTFAGMFALVGFVIWDRRSALSPAVRRIEELREREERLERALRDYALQSPELAESLKRVGLL